MFKSVVLLTKLQICNLFGFNEARFAKDPKKSRNVKMTLVAFLIIGVTLAVYAALLSVGLASFGYFEYVPLYLAFLATVMIFGLNIFRAGAIFDLKSYEKLAVLPVSESAVVASRFLSLYVTNFLFSFVIVASGAIATVVTVGFDLWFLLSMILSSVFLPLLPMTVALVLGTLVYALFSRIKKRSIGKTLLGLVVIAIVIFVPTLTNADSSDAEMMSDIAKMLESLGETLPPIAWLAKGTEIEGIGYYFLYVGLSLAVFVAFSLIVGKYYKKICSGLSSKATVGKFSLTKQKRESALFSLYKRELKRYFSSSVYFMNTFMGNFIALIASFSCLFVGMDSLLGDLGLAPELLWRIIPFLIALIVNLTPMTACSISMEGKGWELTKSLPVEAKTLMQAKLLLQLTFSVSTSLISSLLLAISLKMTGIALLWTFVIPVALSCFVGVLGLFVNIKNPCLSWDNESVPVKQSSSTLICMLVSMASGLVPLIALAFLPVNFLDFGFFVILLAFFALAWYYYNKVTHVRLNDIDSK
jgi:ABC-2 type transport system permease protein